MSSSSLSTEEDLGPNRSSNKVRKLWKNVQMRFLRYGLVEVDGDHPQYILLGSILFEFFFGTKLLYRAEIVLRPL
uniref:Uncharacterized protein n=1 Tax=Lepeophtheirus salmonis TaxID=72036 RepID=A0A0K2V6X5_LEPSM